MPVRMQVDCILYMHMAHSMLIYVLIPVTGCSKLKQELWNLSHFYLQFVACVEGEIQKQGEPLEKEFKVSSAEAASATDFQLPFTTCG